MAPVSSDVDSLLLSLTDDLVTISGSPYFDGKYTLTTRTESGVGFESLSNSTYSGFLNRYTGQISLIHKGDSLSDGSFRVRQLISGKCSLATQPLF